MQEKKALYLNDLLLLFLFGNNLIIVNFFLMQLFILLEFEKKVYVETLLNSLTCHWIN